MVGPFAASASVEPALRAIPSDDGSVSAHVHVRGSGEIAFSCAYLHVPFRSPCCSWRSGGELICKNHRHAWIHVLAFDCQARPARGNAMYQAVCRKHAANRYMTTMQIRDGGRKSKCVGPGLCGKQISTRILPCKSRGRSDDGLDKHAQEQHTYRRFLQPVPHQRRGCI